MISVHQPSSRGATLLAVLCFVSVLAIGVTSYISLCHRSLELSSRSFEHERAWQLAEAGLEQALWSLNQASLATGFDGWTTIDSTTAELTFNPDLEGNTQAAVTVRVEDISTTPGERPITVTSTVTLPNGTVLTRQLQAEAKPLPTFINAITGLDSVDFGSNTAEIDSYNSDDGEYDDDDNFGYSAIIAGDRVDIYKAQVKGYLAAENQSKIEYYVHAGKGKDTSATVKGPSTAKGVNLDTQRLLRFDRNAISQPLPDIAVPTGGLLLSPVTQTIGVPGASEPEVYYVAANLGLGNIVITIQGPVQLRVPGNIHMLTPSSTGKFVINPGGSLELFVGGVFHVPYISLSPFFLGSINDFFDNQTEDPKTLVIYGTQATNAATTDFTTRDNSDDFYGTLYFPNSDLKIRGNGHIYGSIVAKTVELLGNTKIHYDETLRESYFRGLRVPYAVEEVIASD